MEEIPSTNSTVWIMESKVEKWTKFFGKGAFILCLLIVGLVILNNWYTNV